MSLKMLTLLVLFPYFVKRIRFMNVTFCYSAESGKNIVSQGKVRKNENLKIMAILSGYETIIKTLIKCLRNCIGLI